MQATLEIEEDLLREAQELTGIEEESSLVQAGLKALIAREAGIRLAKLGGTQPELEDIPRRRSEQ